MNPQNNTPSTQERWVAAQFIKSDGAIELYPQYMVSDRGRIASMKGKTMRIRKPVSKKDGYLKLNLCINGTIYSRSVHRLILSSFNSGEWSIETNEVDHKDRNPANNFLDNLHWTDKNSNQANRALNPLKKIKLTYLSDGRTEVFDNMVDCSKAHHMNDNWCSHIIRNQKGFHKGLNILIEKI